MSEPTPSSVTPQMSLDAALKRATREFEGGSESDDKWRRPFFIAARAIKLMFPEVDEESEDIQTDGWAWEYPNLPTARKLVREYLEMREAECGLRDRKVEGSVTTQPLRKAIAPATPPRKTVYYGVCSDELVFIPADQATHLARVRRAGDTAKTWGEFKELAGAKAYAELLECLSDAAGRRRNPKPGAKLEFWSLGPVGDGDYPPNPVHDVLDWMPEDIIEDFGNLASSALGEELVGFSPSDETALLKRLHVAGFDCVRSQELVEEAFGMK